MKQIINKADTNKCEICFVVLHYNNYNDTFECVDSIINSLNNSVYVVIVDNGSKNRSYKALYSKYKENSHIFLIKNDDNLGFAKGNNVGYKYAKYHLKARFIAILNNDIVIDDSHIIEKFLSSYQSTGYYVMGPDIISLTDGGHQNPMKTDSRDTKVIKKNINYFRILRLLNRIGVYDLFKNIHRNNSKKIEEKIQSESLYRKENVQLHGSFVVFSCDYIDKEEFAFCPDTFLYREEAILFLICEKKGYKTVFDPNIRVYHKEDSSVNFTYVNGSKRREFVFSQLIFSYKIYLKLLKEKG